jgi:hypothetical protein
MPHAILNATRVQYFGIALPRSESWAPFVAVNWDFLLMAALYAAAACFARHCFPAAYLFSQGAAFLSHLLSDPQRAHTRALRHNDEPVAEAQ